MATTSVEQDNIASVRRGFQAFQNSDIATLAELFHPDATWRSAPSGVLGSDHTGQNDIFSMFGKIGSETQGSFAVNPLAFAASGDQVFVHALASGTRNGKSLNADEVLIFTLADNKVRDVQLFMHDYTTSAAFWQ
jgi:ketosteroid isomerase-like protein